MLDFINDNLFNAKSDLIVIPISCEGTISESFMKELKNLNIQIEYKLKRYKLGDIQIQEVPSSYHFKYIVFACVVDNFESAYYSIRLVAHKIAEFVEDKTDIKEIATPILGTGAGKLNHFKSRNIMLSAFYEIAKSSKSLTFYTLDKRIFNSFGNNIHDINTPSSQLVIEAELPRINNEGHIVQLTYDAEFYFELARKKLWEYRNYSATENSFYEAIEQEFKNSKLPFKDFLKLHEDNDQYFSFLTLCGELIAYLDYNAYRKNIWNKYADKRVLARAGVRQNDWFLNLIKFKKSDDINLLSPSIRNAFIYLLDPSDNLTMLSKTHREKVEEELKLGEQKTLQQDDNYTIHYFKSLGIKTSNAENFGALCSRILYLPYIKPIWHHGIAKEKDLFLSEINLYHASNLIDDCLKTKSKKLDLGNLGIRDLCLIPELFECIHLEELILSNEWGEFENGVWTPQYSINAGKKNTIEYIPSDIDSLINLKVLICGGDWDKKNKLSNRWPIDNIDALTALKNLQYLNVSNCEIKHVRYLNQFDNLEVIFLNNNKIETIEVLKAKSPIRQIYLGNNYLKSVTFLKDISTIGTIDLHNNNIKDLRPIEHLIENIGIENDKWKLETISIAKNPLEQPPMEIINISKEAVLTTLNDIRKRGKFINKDIKIILVGNSEVGKSTLVKYLDNEQNLEVDHLPTLWMQEKIVKSKYKINSLQEECSLHLFDFGGHDYYHDTHHLFYGSNAIYILLWTSQTNNLNLRSCIQLNHNGDKIKVDTQDYPMKYWLESIKFYIKDIEGANIKLMDENNQSYNSSLLLLQNKVGTISEIEFLNNFALKKDYPFIYDITTMSIKSPRRNMEQFDILLTEILNSMQIIGATLPKFYEIIKNSFSNYSGKPVISKTDFLTYCNNLISSPIDMTQAYILIRYLEQIGILLFSDKHPDGLIYMDKKWLINSIHSVLRDLKDMGGEFDRNYLIEEKNIESNHISSVLDMMLDFKIIFKHPFAEKYIAPLYLPQMPETKINLFLQQGVVPSRRFEYSGFIQKSIVLSIFQQYSSLILPSISNDSDEMFYYWKDGLIIKKPTTQEIAMIKFHIGNEDGNACIDIYNLNLTIQKDEFIDEIIGYIREINKGYKVEEMVTLEGKDFISIAVLNKNAKHGKFIFTEKKLKDFKQVKDEEKFFNLKNYKKYTTEEIKRKKVVISYSKKDLEQVNSLKRYLQPLVEADLIEEPWYCTALIPGDEWDLTIQEKFDQADIVFFMASEYFFNTKYIIDHEITNAINRYDNDKSVKIVPIILDFYDWSGKGKYNLQRFSALPYQAKPISDFHNPNIAWSTITTTVRMMIEKDLDPGKLEIIGRDLQEIYERQVRGSLDDNTKK
jgi:internalin A